MWLQWRILNQGHCHHCRRSCYGPEHTTCFIYTADEGAQNSGTTTWCSNSLVTSFKNCCYGWRKLLLSLLTTYHLVPVLASNYKQHILSPTEVREVFRQLNFIYYLNHSRVGERTVHETHYGGRHLYHRKLWKHVPLSLSCRRGNTAVIFTQHNAVAARLGTALQHVQLGTRHLQQLYVLTLLPYSAK
jgi:hypothetical protein